MRIKELKEVRGSERRVGRRDYGKGSESEEK